MFETTVQNLSHDIQVLEEQVEAVERQRKRLRQQLRQAKAVLKKLEDQPTFRLATKGVPPSAVLPRNRPTEA